jgi:hypothetical protein
MTVDIRNVVNAATMKKWIDEVVATGKVVVARVEIAPSNPVQPKWKTIVLSFFVGKDAGEAVYDNERVMWVDLEHHEKIYGMLQLAQDLDEEEYEGFYYEDDWFQTQIATSAN